MDTLNSPIDLFAFGRLEGKVFTIAQALDDVPGGEEEEEGPAYAFTPPWPESGTGTRGTLCDSPSHVTRFDTPSNASRVRGHYCQIRGDV